MPLLSEAQSPTVDEVRQRVLGMRSERNPAGEPKSAPGHVNVNQQTIDQIASMGPEQAVQHAVSGSASDEFVEGTRRYYPGYFARALEALQKQQGNAASVTQANEQGVSPAQQGLTQQVTPSNTPSPGVGGGIGGGTGGSMGAATPPSPASIQRKLGGATLGGIAGLPLGPGGAVLGAGIGALAGSGGLGNNFSDPLTIIADKLGIPVEELKQMIAQQNQQAPPMPQSRPPVQAGYNSRPRPGA